MSMSSEKRRKRRKLLIIISASVLVIALAGILGLVIIIKHRQPQTQFRHYTEAMTLLEEGRYADASVLFEKTLERTPNQPEVLSGLARAHAGMGEPDEAAQLATEAWDKGLRNLELFALIDAQWNDAGAGTGTDANAERRRLLSELAEASYRRPETERNKLLGEILDLLERRAAEFEHPELEGDIAMVRGQQETAIAFWIKAMETTPNPDLVAKIARATMALKDPEGYGLRLISVPSPGEIPAEGKSVVIAARINDEWRFRIFDADGRMETDISESEVPPSKRRDMDQMKSALNSIADAGTLSSDNREYIITLIRSAIGSTHQDSARRFLTAAREDGMLNDSGYALLGRLLLLDAEFEGIEELFAEAKEKGEYSEQLQFEHSILRMVQNDFDGARALLEPLQSGADSDAEPFEILLRRSARLFSAYLSLLQRDSETLDRLEQLAIASPDGGPKEGEVHFIEAIRLLMDRSDRELATEQLTKASRGIQSHPLIEMLLAGHFAEKGDYKTALDHYAKVKGPLALWPQMRLSLATVLEKTNNDKEAMKVLNELHKRNLYSKRSIQLVRDLAFRNQKEEIGLAAKEYLEATFSDDPDVKTYQALFALKNRDYETAAEVFSRLRDEHPDEVRYELGRIQVLIATGKYEEALEAYDRSGAPPEILEPMKALAYAKLERWDEAIAAFETATQSGASETVHREFGNLLYGRGNYQRAAEQYGKAIELNPDSFDAHLGLAMAAERLGDWQTCLQHARALLDGNRALDANQLKLLALAELRTGQLSDAADHCRQALEFEPLSAELTILDAAILEANGNLEQAASRLRDALALKPENEDPVRVRLALVQKRRGTSETLADALAQLDQILKRNPNAIDLKVHRFETLALLNRLDEAETQLKSMSAELAADQLALGESWLAELKQDDDKALQLLEPHLDNPAAGFRWAMLQFRAKNPDTGLDAIRDKTLNVTQWVQLGQRAEQNLLRSAAVFCYAKALELAPDNPLILNNWAWNIIESSTFPGNDVVDAARRAHEAVPDNADILDTYATALFKTAKYDRCIELLTANTFTTRRSPRLLWVLGRANELSNRHTPALTAFENARRLIAEKPGVAVGETPEELAARIKRLKETPEFLLDNPQPTELP